MTQEVVEKPQNLTDSDKYKIALQGLLRQIDQSIEKLSVNEEIGKLKLETDGLKVEERKIDISGKLTLSDGHELDLRIFINKTSGETPNRYLSIEINKDGEYVLGFVLRSGGLESIGFAPALSVGDRSVKLEKFGVSYPGSTHSVAFDLKNEDKYRYLGISLAEWMTACLKEKRLVPAPEISLAPEIVFKNSKIEELAKTASGGTD